MLIAIGVIGGLAIVALVGWIVFYAPQPSAPTLDNDVSRLSIKVGDINRDYIAVVPAHLTPGAPLWVVLHGASSNAEDMRFITGYQFEELAAREGFVVVYPDGYKRSWHDCRTATKYPARAEGIDDVAFLTSLVADLTQKHGLDAGRAYGFGYSNGAHMLYKMLAQSPKTFAVIVANAANLSEPGSSDCINFSIPKPVMLVEGTRDPLNPFAGGRAGSRGNPLGEVKSAIDSAIAFARVNGVAGPASDPGINSVEGAPVRTLVAGVEGKRRSVVLKEFGGGSGVPVRLYAVKGGGHVVPNTGYRAPRMMGRSSKNFDAPIVAWEFTEALTRSKK
ncbi:alpha/beta hydrolase family esterase [Demequina oxidasica]|uniref:alpha/beta hydrolase family esterase n=1 Tax=Demequina oxidasica TaxID=676199 RepID=UPI000780B219|nr:PHB depolymerase family esterase [Demequina oxidasica]